MKRKGFLILLILALAVLCLFSCKRGNDLPSENEYPEGAIALTTDNLFAYFDAEVTTRCQYDYGYGQTDVSSYVALVPRGEYAEIVGEISFELNAVVRQYGLSNLKLRVSNSTHRLRLESDGVTNTEINATVSGGGSSVTQELVPVEDSNSITLKSVTGYVILGEKKPYPHELITDSQRAESAEILSELRYRVEELKTEYDSAESFNYLSQTKYNLTSVFGEDLSVNRTATHKGVTVDLVNRRFKIGSDVYYVYNGTPVCQSLGTNGFVTLSKTGMTLDGVMSEYPPVWEIFDTGAVYFKEGENLYVAVTTLYDMSDGVFKQRLLAELADKGITTKYNRMTVRYEYGFDAGSLMLLVTVDYTDLQYDVDYVNIHAETIQKITDINNTEVRLYNPDSYIFLPADSLEEAMELGGAEITLEKGREYFTATTYSYEYEGWTNPPTERYFPLVIEESGVYTLTPERDTLAIYDAEGRQIYPESRVYLTAGRYYLCLHGVLYGREDRRIDVDVIYLEDYGEVSNAAPIENGEYSVRFEATSDRVAFSFTPDGDGLYSLLKREDVTLYLYSAGEDVTLVDEIWAEEHTAMLTAGVEYILLLEYRGTQALEFTAEVEYIGAPTSLDGFVLSEEWQEVFLYADGFDKLPVSVTVAGEYYVELEWIAGQEEIGGSFYTADGSYYDLFKYVYINGVETKITQLDCGEYYFDVDVYSNGFFKGRVRLVTHATRITEQSEAVIGTESYTTLTTSDLSVTYSTSTFTFEVTEDSVLYWTEDSDFFTIYDENGNRISTYANTVFDGEHNIWVEYSGKLTAGKYTIVFTIDEYAKPGVKTAELRLNPV
ncbi:MAG: hypothetical protein IJF05_05370 [Clostridia bacterium]|nr:hypothetical protein [Clostridia bacterium]